MKPEYFNSNLSTNETDTGFTTTPLDTVNAPANAFFLADTNDKVFYELH